MSEGCNHAQTTAIIAERLQSSPPACNQKRAHSDSMELKQPLGDRFGLFSGVEFDVDAARGLNALGQCIAAMVAAREFTAKSNVAMKRSPGVRRGTNVRDYGMRSRVRRDRFEGATVPGCADSRCRGALTPWDAVTPWETGWNLITAV